MSAPAPSDLRDRPYPPPGATNLAMPLIDATRDPQTAADTLKALRAKLSPQGDVVSPRGRALTREVFGEALAPREVVQRILEQVRTRGCEALLEFTRKLDHADLTPDTLRVSADELAQAHRAAAPEYLDTIRRVRGHLEAFQTAILHQDITVQRGPGHRLTQRYRPLKRVGVCVPGGAAAYPSSLMMTVIPARAAGVEQIAVVVPPTAFGGYNANLLAACHELGVTEIYRIGGAQAVAALAYGVEGIAPVDKIVGPGNLFVALAKQAVYGVVDIDSIAGPSEVVVLADETARPDYLAADLISQAEHAPGSSLLITWVEGLAEQVLIHLERQLAGLERGDLARESLEQFGALIRVANRDEAIALTNQIAPEHLHISTNQPAEDAERLHAAGAIFLGHDAPVAAGDYAAGPSHVLPTGGTPRWASGLCSNDFLKRTSLIEIDHDGLAALAPDITRLADIEGLPGHKLSVTIRLDSRPTPGQPGQS